MYYRYGSLEYFILRDTIYIFVIFLRLQLVLIDSLIIFYSHNALMFLNSLVCIPTRVVEFICHTIADIKMNL